MIITENNFFRRLLFLWSHLILSFDISDAKEKLAGMKEVVLMII